MQGLGTVILVHVLQTQLQESRGDAVTRNDDELVGVLVLLLIREKEQPLLPLTHA